MSRVQMLVVSPNSTLLAIATASSRSVWVRTDITDPNVVQPDAVLVRHG
jgi:hypothetical protein